MDATPNLDCFDAFTARLIQAKARQLIGRAGLTESDRADLVQEFSLNLLRRLDRFDPHLGSWQKFVVIVCENYCATILEHRAAQKRSPAREAGSLNRQVSDADGIACEAGSLLPESQYGRRCGRYPCTHIEQSDLIQDIADTLDGLSPQLRQICNRLKRESTAQVARDMGVPVKRLYARKKAIRERFERANLKEYL
ncbi:sigma-70 family RNA polymerase sigma factor [Roseiconus nitratireducens]|uniref:Sigma-70 family RNA polymerase sigma factor n=1 Tax=Roseiconus nitratireducens TaxID=2605748 RepID=A0A5M6D3I4_9BACT|nr:sigma-70 family RNA polymerase sigma factor [Roseiconus nitratireducens]KAA5541893.1 sigma-70 family RNA polymerase sigma factor [Roseiconus nitratireducens]